jgi:hypothetical protein
MNDIIKLLTDIRNHGLSDNGSELEINRLYDRIETLKEALKTERQLLRMTTAAELLAHIRQSLESEEKQTTNWLCEKCGEVRSSVHDENMCEEVAELKEIIEKLKNGYKEVERAITEREELLGRIRYANEVIAACVTQFTQYDKSTKELYILFESSAEEDLCVYAEKMGIIKRVPGKVDRFKWVKNDQ